MPLFFYTDIKVAGVNAQAIRFGRNLIIRISEEVMNKYGEWYAALC